MPGPRSVDEHRARILEAIEPLTAVPQPLMETLGLAAAEDVVAGVALPSFDNSGMDGYAVRAEDVATASEASPVHLPVVGEIGAGVEVVGDVKLQTGAAERVAPGSVLEHD